MGAIHLHFDSIEDVACRGGNAAGGRLLAVDPSACTVQVLVDVVLSRALPQPARWPARWWRRWRPATVPAPVERRFELTPPPVATDAHSHPVFLRIEGEVPPSSLRVGDRVWVVSGVGCTAALRDEEPGSARIRAAFDRAGDLAWAEGAGEGDLHGALLDRRRADAALAELRWRRALDVDGFAACRPVTDLPTLLDRVQAHPRDRTRLVAAAAARLAGAEDRDALHAVTRALFDRVGLEELLPLLMLVDPADPGAAEVALFARARLDAVVREEPGRADVFAAARSRFGPPTPPR